MEKSTTLVGSITEGRTQGQPWPPSTYTLTASGWRKYSMLTLIRGKLEELLLSYRAHFTIRNVIRDKKCIT